MQYDANGRLTRAGAMAVLQQGQSVCIRGVVITSIANLPNEAAFAMGNPQAEAVAKSRLQQQINEAQKQLMALGGTAPGTISVAASQATAPGDGFDDMTAADLKKLASERHVKNYGPMTKAEVIAALREPVEQPAA